MTAHVLTEAPDWYAELSAMFDGLRGDEAAMAPEPVGTPDTTAGNGRRREGLKNLP